jgi:tetratricopeptide (TPR) repeat protein
MILNRHVEARDAVAPIFDLTVQLNDLRRLPGIYNAFGTYYLWVEEDYSKGLEYLSKAATTSEKTGSLWYLWQSCFYLGISLSWNCEFEKSTECFRRSLDLSEKAGNLGGIAFVKGTMSAHNLSFRGKNDLAYTLSKESLQAANESGDPYNKGLAYSSYGSCCYFKGLFSEAENALLQGRSICEKTGHNSWRFWVTYVLGLMYFDRGEYGKSMKYHQEAHSILELDRSFPSLANLLKVCLERVEVLNNNRNIQLSELPSKYCEKNKLKIFEGTLARYIGEILLKIDDQHMSEAEDWIKKALEVDKKNGTIWSFGADHALYAELFKRKGDRLKAQENMGKAIKILKECGADGWVEKYEKEMAAIS